MMSYKLPDLAYNYSDLEPYIDAKTMEIHHSKHHNAYTVNFNKSIEENGVPEMSIEALFSNISKYPAAVKNNGGGYFNHKLFWEILAPPSESQPEGDLLLAIERGFGSFDEFKERFSKAAATQFGSGWAWLIAEPDGKLQVCSTPNQDNPLMDISQIKGTPILCIDVWEHAYYLNYQNRRPDYIASWWNVVNWRAVAEKFAQAV